MKLKECAPVSNTKIVSSAAKKEIVLSLIYLFKNKNISNADIDMKTI